ncbi:UNVERIFIED_CONTAM: hypothetical protein FKN15_012895 [Acipenser sinensis]
MAVTRRSGRVGVRAFLLSEGLRGAAIINMLKPGASKTFQDYAQKVFLPYVKQQLQHVSRVDIIWDEYVPDSLKAMTCSKQDRGDIIVLGVGNQCDSVSLEVWIRSLSD